MTDLHVEATPDVASPALAAEAKPTERSWYGLRAEDRCAPLSDLGRRTLQLHLHTHTQRKPIKCKPL